MNPLKWVYIGDQNPGIDPVKNNDFLVLMQIAMLKSLVKRNLLTTSQIEQKENIENLAVKRKP